MTIDLEALFIDLHRNPELSFQETRTAAIAAAHLRGLGLEVTEGVGRTGVVGVLANGPSTGSGTGPTGSGTSATGSGTSATGSGTSATGSGTGPTGSGTGAAAGAGTAGTAGTAGPVVWMRADMDGLPVVEQSGLPYASTATGTDPDGHEVGVMHACGHDMHVTAMIGAVEELVRTKDDWSGTVVVLIQPAEEFGAGARAMLDDGLLDRVPRPDVVLGQHVTPLPAGIIGVRPGPQMSASDGLSVVLHGRGGHGSRPHSTIDPIVMAAATVMRLQTVVSREVDPHDLAVVTVGAIHAGTKNNIIPAEARLDLSLRYPDEALREKVLASVERVIRAEAMASGAVEDPTITTLHRLPATINDESATERAMAAFRAAFGDAAVVDPGLFSGSEDVSWFARDAGVPLVFWFWGGIDPARYAAAVANGTVDSEIATNHSPSFAVEIHPTIEVGVQALTVAAREFLD